MEKDIRDKISVMTNDIADTIRRIEIEALSNPIIDRAKVLYLMDDYDKKVLSLDKAIATFHEGKHLTNDEYKDISERMDEAHILAVKGFKGVKARMK